MRVHSFAPAMKVADSKLLGFLTISSVGGPLVLRASPTPSLNEHWSIAVKPVALSKSAAGGFLSGKNSVTPGARAEKRTLLPGTSDNDVLFANGALSTSQCGAPTIVPPGLSGSGILGEGSATTKFVSTGTNSPCMRWQCCEHIHWPGSASCARSTACLTTSSAITLSPGCGFSMAD